MKKFLMIVGFCLFSSFAYGEDTVEILNVIQEKLKGINSYKADFTFRMDSPAGEMFMKGNVLFKREDKIKRETIIPNIPDARELTISNGQTLWQYIPFLKVASKVDLSSLKRELGDAYFTHFKEDISKPLKDADEDFIKYLGKEKIEEEEFFVFEAEPKKEATREIPFTRIKVWIDTNSGLERKAIFYNSEGKELMSWVYENVLINIPIEDEEFEFYPPQDIEIVDMTEETKRYMEREVSSQPIPSFEASPKP